MKILIKKSIRRKRSTVYPDSQKQALVREVEFLSKKLGRPVSSKDLKEYFRSDPMRQPLLRQRLGQQLIKAAYPRLQPVPFLYQVGIIGNLAYYATTPDKEWDEKLAQYALELDIQNELARQTVSRAVSLLGTSYEKMARNALAGFIKQWSFVG